MTDCIKLNLPQKTHEGTWFVRSKEMHYDDKEGELSYMFLTNKGDVMFDDGIVNVNIFYFKDEADALNAICNYGLIFIRTDDNHIKSEPLFDD